MAEESGEAKRNARIFAEYIRWINHGPATGWDRTEVGYLVCLGAYENFNFNSKLLGEIFHDKPSTVSTKLDQMAERGYITLKQDTEDGRCKQINLTEKGKKRYEGCILFLLGNSQHNPINAINDTL